MKTVTLSSVVALGLLGMTSTVSATIANCVATTYADGGIYCRDNGHDQCLGDLGDFPAEKTFSLSIEYTQDKTLRLLRHHSESSQDYTRYREELYIDTSPSALAPLRFTRDNATLARGETSWAWGSVYGSLMWTPDGDPASGTPGGNGVMAGQGFRLVDVEGYPGLRQVYWDQALYDDMYAGRRRGEYFPSLCQHERKEARVVDEDTP